MVETIYIDATNQILGRLATKIAKLLLEGKNVYVFNAEKAVVSGERRRVIEGYKLVLKVRTHYNPDKSGIRRFRSPHMIFKKTVRGMLPMDKPRGRDAYRRLKVFLGVPDEYRGKEMVRFPEADISRLKGRYVYLIDIAKELGWRGVEPRVR